MEEKKNNAGLISIIIILIILLIGAIGYICYNKFLSNKISTNDTTKITITTNSINKKDNISNDMLNEYVSYVPISTVYENDAYSGNPCTVDNINEHILYEMSYLKSNESGGGETRQVLLEDLKKNIKKMYNIIQLNLDEFDAPGSTVTLDNDKWIRTFNQGGISIEKLTKIIKTEIDDKDIIIYEKGAILETGGCFATIYKTHKQLDINSIYKEYSCNENENLNKVVEKAKEFINNNFESFITFKHTFKLNDNNEYYWYSTEVVE